MRYRGTSSSSVLLVSPQSAAPAGSGGSDDRLHDEPSHEAVVDAWLTRSACHGSSAEVVRLFHAALNAVWNRAVTILGPVTLTATAERVLHHATERYTFLSAINPKASGDAIWTERLHERLGTVPSAPLIEGLRYGLIELITIIGALTAEVLRGELHAAIDAVTAPSAPGWSADAQARSELASENVQS
jgi:hypothetical protein